MPRVETKFETNDIVAVFGGSISKDEKSANQISICKVLICGQKDLIVQECRSSSFSGGEYTFKVSKNLCHKLFLDPVVLEKSDILLPEIGDLVMSYEKETYAKKEPVKKTGILYKIIYKYGKPYKGSIICGSKMVEVQYEDLIVIQSNKEE